MNNGLPEYQARVVGQNVVSNAERQRQFRRRNPDYYRNLQAKRRAEAKAWLTATLAAQWAAVAEALALPAPVQAIAIPTRPFPLMLPAPVVDPLMEQLNEMAARLRAGTTTSATMKKSGPREAVEVKRIHRT